MTALSGIVGVGLIAIGVFGYLASGRASVTALIPAFLGAVIAFLGWMAREPSRRRHTMHAAMGVAVLGIVGTADGVAAAVRSLSGGGGAPLSLATVSKFLTCVILAAYLAIGVRSFIAARRARLN